MKNYMQAYQQALAQDRRRLELAKTILIAGLKSIGANQVLIEYDGEGDSGQIHSISAFGAADEPVELNNACPIAIGEDDSRRPYDTLAAFLDDFAWDLLRQYHDGFENNEGGYGTIEIRVPDAAITIDHNDRFVEIATTVTEF